MVDAVVVGGAAAGCVETSGFLYESTAGLAEV